jgi:hypothetical protein
MLQVAYLVRAVINIGVRTDRCQTYGTGYSHDEPHPFTGSGRIR